MNSPHPQKKNEIIPSLLKNWRLTEQLPTNQRQREWQENFKRRGGMVTKWTPHPQYCEQLREELYWRTRDRLLCPWTQEKKSYVLKDQLAYKRDNTRTLPSGREAVGIFSRSEGLEVDMVYVPPHLKSLNQSRAWTPHGVGSTPKLVGPEAIIGEVGLIISERLWYQQAQSLQAQTNPIHAGTKKKKGAV